jgi:hypothetical protein
MERVAGLVEVERGKPEQIESGLHKFGMTDDDIDDILDSLLVSKLTRDLFRHVLRLAAA